MIENSAEVVPSGTVTLAGTLATVLLLAKINTAPPVGAGLLRNTVPVEESPAAPALPEEPASEEDEPLPSIPPDLQGDPDLDAIIARAEGRLPEQDAVDEEDVPARPKAG